MEDMLDISSLQVVALGRGGWLVVFPGDYTWSPSVGVCC